MKALYILPIFVFSCLFALAQAPVNDDCSGIIDLGAIPYCSQAAAFTNVKATTSLIDPVTNVPTCWNNLGERDVWFQFNLPANGSITDISIGVWGDIIGNGTLKMPQIALYRGDCEFGGLAELSCIAAPLNVNEAHLDLFGLTPGVPYFIRINDYSATASPNSGTFKLCVEPYVPDVNIGDASGSSSCTGTLWDSGGPDGDYENSENKTFVICPTEFHQCIHLNFISYATEPGYDNIQVFAGDDIASPIIRSINGVGANLQIQIGSDCATIQFISDGSIFDEGFQMTWQCSPEVCDAPPPVLPPNDACYKAININGCATGPEIIPLSPGAGDPNFILQGLNQGCIAEPSPDFNFSFFYFTASVDGKFGFAVQSANPLEATDIDFNVWGPINSVAEICDFVSTHQPIRSSWDEGTDLTGLADIHPVTGNPVLDDFDCGSPATPGTDPPLAVADDFVRRINVKTGEVYVIMLDDYDGAIEHDGIAIDFSGTTPGVLGPVTPPITVTKDNYSCNGEPVQLLATGGLGYAWVPSTGLSCNTCSNPIVTTSAATSYVLKVVDVCQSLTDTVKIKVGPVVNVQNDTAICNGQSVLLGHTIVEPGVTYTWTPNDGSLDDPNSANPIATPLQTTVYTLKASIGPCLVTKVVTVAVVNLDLSLNFQDTSICKGELVEIVASVNPAGALVNWTPLTALQLQLGGLSAISKPNKSISYTITATVSGCIRKDTVNISVDSLPANLSIFPKDTLVCAGTQLLLSSPSYIGAQYPDLKFVWQSSTGQVFPEDEYFFVATPTENTTYQRITTNGACVDTAKSIIKVIPVPTLSIASNKTQLCIGETANLTVSNTAGLSNFNWSPPIGLSCINCLNPTAAPSSTTNYQFTASVGNGCTASASILLEVNQQPIFQFPKDTLCIGESLVLNLINDPTVDYLWTSIPAGFTSTEAQPIATPTQTTTYLVTMENGCTVQQQFKIQVVQDGNLMVTDSSTICAGVSKQLVASGNFPGIFEWSNGTTGQVTTVSPTTSGTYTVIYQYPAQNPQCRDTASVFVGVQGTAGQVQFPSDVLLCPGEGILLNSLATPGATYSWSADPPIFASNDPIPPVIFPEESATFNVTTVLGGCSVSYQLEVTVFNPQMMVTADTTICAGEPVTIGAEALLTGDYLWTPGGPIPTFVDTISVNSQYTLQFEYGAGCVFMDTVNIKVKQNFSIKLVSDPDSNRINAGAPIFLDAFIPGTNVSNFSFEWLENEVVPVGNTQQVTVTPATLDSIVVYTVTVVSPNGCVQTETIAFTIIQPNIKIPNAFTPNGDGANDSFGLVLVEGVATVEKMDVYSRWGQKVFSSNDPKARWDGRIEDKEAPSDVYVYVIFYRSGDGALVVAKGEVTLLR